MKKIQLLEQHGINYRLINGNILLADNEDGTWDDLTSYSITKLMSWLGYN